MPRNRLESMREPWEELLESTDVFSDLSDLYPEEFYRHFAGHFDRAPHPLDLVKDVLNTAYAYAYGKWRKQADNGFFLKFTARHLIGAGLSARRLAYELRQVQKSDLATDWVALNLPAQFADSERPYGQCAYRAARLHNGPKARLRHIEELAAALETAIAEIVPLPADSEDEAQACADLSHWADEINQTHRRGLSKNFAMEEAARCFRPIWERHSTLPFQRGRYRHEIGGYDCKPGNALHAIIARIDRSIAPSLAGTAIENIRKHS